MSVKIRLSRIGRKHVPFSRIVVVDSRKKRDGEYIAKIGTYDMLNRKIIAFDKTLFDEWVSKGAQPSDSAKKIYRMYKRSLVEQPKAKPAPQKKAAPKAAPKAKEETPKKKSEEKEA